MSEPPRRFIAGAVCPQCGEMDKLRAWREGDVQLRECVRCGFRDRASTTVVTPPPTRVTPRPPATGKAMRFYPKGDAKKGDPD